MQFSQTGNTYMVFVQQDEPVIASLTAFCKDHGIINAQVSGIGAVKNIELGAFDVPTKSYVRKHFPDHYELISFQGNVTQLDGEPFVHAHISLGNHNMEQIGGHLFEMQVAAVGEFILRKIDLNIHRELDSNIGLATWCLVG